MKRAIQSVCVAVVVSLGLATKALADDPHLSTIQTKTVGSEVNVGGVPVPLTGRANSGIGGDDAGFCTSSSLATWGNLYRYDSNGARIIEGPGYSNAPWANFHLGDIGMDDEYIYAPVSNASPGSGIADQMGIAAFFRNTLQHQATADMSYLIDDYPSMGDLAGVDMHGGTLYAIEYQEAGTSRLFTFDDLSAPSAVYPLASTHSNGVAVYANTYGKYAYLSTGHETGVKKGTIDVYDVLQLRADTINSPLARYTYDTPNIHAEGLTFRNNQLWVAQDTEIHRLEMPITPGPVVITEGFDGYSTGSLPDPPWTDLSDPGVTAEVTNSVSYAGGQSLHFNDTSSGAGIKLKRSFDPVTSVMLEYYMRTDNDVYEGHFVSLEGDSTSSYGWDKSMGAVTFGNASGGGSAGWIGLIDDGGWPEPEILQYETGKWYRVRRWIDIVADEETTHVDEMGGSGHGEYFRTGIKHDNTEINAFHIWSSTSQGADAYLDEITLTPEPATLSLLMLSGFAMIRRRKKTPHPRATDARSRGIKFPIS